MGKIFVKEKLIQVESNSRIRLHLFREKGFGLINFIYQLEFNHEKKWKVVVRYDCFHGFFHKDLYSPSGRKRKIMSIPDFKNMKEALNIAKKDLIMNREIYIRRFWGDRK